MAIAKEITESVARMVLGLGFYVVVAVVSHMDSSLIAIGAVHWGVMAPCTVDCRGLRGQGK